MGLFLYSSSQVNDIKTNSKGRKIILSRMSQLCKMVPPSQQELGMQTQPRAFNEALRCKGHTKLLGKLGRSPITTQNHLHCSITEEVRSMGLQVKNLTEVKPSDISIRKAIIIEPEKISWGLLLMGEVEQGEQTGI